MTSTNELHQNAERLTKRLKRNTPDEFTQELLDFGETFVDDDCRQTYYLHRLEGMSHEEALKQATVSRAQPLHQNSKQRGPTDAAGRRPLTVAFGASDRSIRNLWNWEHYHSFTQDSRTVEEREFDIQRAELISQVVSDLTENQQEVIRRMYGLDGHHPQTYEQIADELGRTRNQVANAGFYARRRLRVLLEME